MRRPRSFVVRQAIAVIWTVAAALTPWVFFALAIFSPMLKR